MFDSLVFKKERESCVYVYPDIDTRTRQEAEYLNRGKRKPQQLMRLC